MAEKLVSMKMTRAEREERMSAEPAKMDQPVYPYGLEVRLDEEALEKLDLGELPEVGSTMMLLARVSVSSVSDNAHAEGGTEHRHRTVTLQITDLCLEEGTKPEDLADALYDGGSAEK